MKKTLQYVVYVLFFAILVYSPVARGLFFRPDYTRFFMATAGFFALVLVDSLLRGTALFRGDIADWGMLFLAVFYGLSSIKAVSRMEAVDGALRYASLLLLYVAARHVATERAGRTLIAASVFVSAVVTGVIGLGAAVEIIAFPGAYENLRIYGSLQYPNALAAYAMFASFAGYYLWTRCTREARWLGPLVGFGMYLLTTVILCSQSRITWLMYPAFLILYALVMPVESRRSFVTVMILTLLATIGASPWFLRSLSQKQPRVALGYLISGAVAVLVVESLRAYLTPRLQEAALRAKRRVPRRGGEGKGDRSQIPFWARPQNISLAALVALVAVGMAVLAVPGWRTTVSELVPVQIARRFASITLRDRSLLVRLFSLQDAFAIARDHPLLGTGAGGWNALYHQYQRVLYYYTETHSHVGQVVVETGFGGLLAYTAIWAGTVYALYAVLRLYRQARRDLLVSGAPQGTGFLAGSGEAGDGAKIRPSALVRIVRSPLANVMDEAAAFGAAALSLGAHSSLDFELSLPAVMAALLAAIAGLVSARDSAGEQAKRRAPTGKSEGRKKTTGPAAISGVRGHPRVEGTGLLRRFVPSWRRGAELLCGFALLCAIWIPSSSHLEGMKIGATGVYYAVQFQDYQAAKDNLLLASKLDPHSSEYPLNLARLAYFRYQDSGEEEYRQEVRNHLETARRLRPDDVEDVQARAGLLSEMGFLDEAADECARLLKLIPLSRDVYETYAKLAMEAVVKHGEEYVAALGRSKSGEGRELANQAELHKLKIREYVDKVLNLPEAMAFRKAGVTGTYAEFWNPKNLDPSARMNLYLGQAYYLAGEAQDALDCLSRALGDASSRQDAATWLRCVSLATGRPLTVKLPVAPDESAVARIRPLWGLAGPE